MKLGRGIRYCLSAIAVVVVVLAGLQVANVLPQFGMETVDRSSPAMLQSVRDLSRYHAAVGEFQVVVDIEQDVKWLPRALAGQRTLFVAAGTVDAYVDLGGLADDALVVSSDGRTATLMLPAPQFDKPNLDPERTYVFNQQRGLVNRLGAIVEVPDQRSFHITAEEKIAAAARDAGLVDRAKTNTTAMLTALFTRLGFAVTVTVEGG